MQQSISYFEGHGGAVIALAKGDTPQTFFSVGAEGLVVRWDINTPNEGEVIVKLPGLISAISFDVVDKLIYATINHKGLFVICPTKRKVMDYVELPGASFGQIGVGKDYIVISTHFGEILMIEKATLKITHRISSGLSSFPTFIVTDNIVNYASNTGTIQFKLDDFKKKTISFKHEIKCFYVYNHFLICSSDTGIYFFDKERNKLVFKHSAEEEGAADKIIVDSESGLLLSFVQPNAIRLYLIEKKRLKLHKSVHIEHIGGINDILSIENHKFVITAGINNKIGVWQLN